jgi:glycerol-3-phosphate dehydrogenase (NAD(P)+)
VLVKIADLEAIAVPIAQQVNKLLQGEITPESAIKALMERNLKSEFYDLDF